MSFSRVAIWKLVTQSSLKRPRSRVLQLPSTGSWGGRNEVTHLMAHA